jgi:Tfp pilus assembly ATPase PilU
MVGMQRMDTALMRMHDANLITAEEAYFKSRNKADFEHLIENIDELEENTGLLSDNTLNTN